MDTPGRQFRRPGMLAVGRGGDMTAAVYTNELEQQVSRLPGFLQSVLRDPFDWVDGVLKGVAGQPDQLVSAGRAYAGLGRQSSSLALSRSRTAWRFSAVRTRGRRYKAFSAKMAEVEQQISTLGQATGQTQQLLDSAAQACAQSASMIVYIVEGTISFILQDAVVSGVLSLFTFGAAAAAGAAAALAKFAAACEKIGGIVAKLTSVLEKVAALLEKTGDLHGCQELPDGTSGPDQGGQRDQEHVRKGQVATRRNQPRSPDSSRLRCRWWIHSRAGRRRVSRRREYLPRLEGPHDAAP